MTIIAFSVAAVSIYIYRLLAANKLTSRFAASHGNEYIKFQYVGYWNEVLMYMVGILVFLGNVKFLRLLRFNKRLGLLASTLRYGAKPLFMFSIIFAIIFLGFTQLFYFIYFVHILNFKTIVTSAETCLQMLVGKFDFYAMQTASPVLGPVFFFLYVLTVYYILVNMFLTILNDAFARVRRDVALQSNDYEMVDFVLRRFRQWTGLGQLMGGGKAAPATHPGDGKTVQPHYPIDNLPATVDRFLAAVSKAYFNQDTFDAIFEANNGNRETVKLTLTDQRARMARMVSEGRPVLLPDVDYSS